jgi:hypothetical protein
MARSESLLPGGVRISDLVTLGALAEGVPAEDIDAAISGLEGKRRTRSLPPRLTVLYVIAMAVYRDVSLEEVLSCLLEGLRWLGLGPVRPAVKSAITQARVRLGSTPLRLLFERLARPLATDLTIGSHYRSWLTVAFDGTVLDLPDTQSNVQAYGYPGASRGSSAFPQLRSVALCETGAHAAFAAAMGPYSMGEISLAKQVIPRLSKGMLLLADRNYFGFSLWQQAQSTGADLLWRVKKNVRLRVLNRFPDGSFLSAVYEDPTRYRTKEGGIPVRVVEYTVEGSDDTYRLVTTILDPEQAPAEELATVYTQRWEVETMFDEIKTHIKGSRLTLRSKTAELVEQEFWGMMIAHRVLRSLMHEAALRQNLDPDKISMVHTIRVVKRTMPSRASFSP